MDEVVTGPERCRQLLQSVNKKLGFVSEETWATLNVETREAFRLKDDMIFSAVATLAKNLYTSNARFVLELLQNAEDNRYSSAKEKGQQPYVAFQVHHDRIVVECNEDGFTKGNLQAICDVGKSSKTGDQQGYIGEKGIGFKSVFMAAWKVDIQSGDLSFYFKHRNQDKGLGMIHPVWLKPTEKLPRPLTRMTLWLHEDGGEEQRTSRSETIRQQFKDLDSNLLLFMAKLKEIRVSYFDNNGNQESSTVFSIRDTGNNLVTVTKSVVKGSEDKATESQVYYLVKHTVGNLEKNENRSYSADEEQTSAYATAKVVLGFPLNADSVPIDQHQKVFAFLPMREKGFKFLIQGDFVTQANREDIVTTSRRNIGILSGISDAFMKAVSEFCEHPTLQYDWVKFLPDKEGYYDTFWTRLIQMIEKGLRKMPVLQPWSHRTMRTISDLRQAVTDRLDKNGEPLFGGTCLDVLISWKYGHANLQRLRTYGLNYISYGETLDFVEQDLRLDISRMKSPETDDDWHTRVAHLLAKAYGSKIESIRKRVCQLQLLPLQDGRWAAPDTNVIHFSESAGIPIPQQTGLTLLDAVAEKNPQRMELFRHLGIKTASVDLVCRMILDPFRHSNLAILIRVNHLKFIYLTHHLVVDPTIGRSMVRVINHEHHACLPRMTDVYLPDEHEFGVHELFGKAGTKDMPDDALQLSFLHEIYLQSSPEKPHPTADSWRDWLYSYAGVRRYVRLVSADQRQKLSKAVYFVMAHHPKKFFGFLRHHWSEGGSEITDSLELQESLRDIPVLCEGGQMIALKETYLPFPDLKSQCTKFLRGQESFPFLFLNTAVERGTYAQNWSFLVPRFRIGLDADMEFYKRILLQIRVTNPLEVKDPERINELYKTIYGKYAESPLAEMNKMGLRTFFVKNSLVFVPSGQAGEAVWAKPNECLWDAPPFFASRCPLKSRLKKVFASEPITWSMTERLFIDILKIPDWNWRHIVEELKYTKEQIEEDIDNIYVLYERLQTLAFELPAEDMEEIKAAFTDNALIYVKNNGDGRWHQISTCLWSSATKIHGKTVLDKDYEDLEQFFVEFLEVATLDLQLVYDELIRLGSAPDASAEQVTEQIRALNGLLGDSSAYPKVKPQRLRNARVFPVRTPGADVEPKLSKAEDFLIVDRAHLGRLFASQVRTLAFDLDQVHELTPFLQWLGLEDRYYLSHMVKEISMVDEADKIAVPLSHCRIRSKAYALCCIAFHYHSPRLESTSLDDLRNMLQAARVYKTNGISCVLQLSVGGPPIVKPLSSSDLHLHEGESQLDIFIPRKRIRREFCFADKLPARLFQWLMTDPSNNQWGESSEKGYRMVASVLNTTRSVSSQILEVNGILIPPVDDFAPDEESQGSERGEAEESSEDDDRHGEEEDLRDEAYGREQGPPRVTMEESAMSSEFMTSGAPSMRPFTPSTTNSQDTSSHLPELREISYISMRVENTASRSQSIGRVSVATEAPRTRGYAQPDPRPEFTHEDIIKYRQLLDSIISSAREANFPSNSNGPMDMSALLAELPTDEEAESSFNIIGESIRFRSKNQLERDKMIGAAGELYVFELLKSLNPELSGFSVDNWQSTIRAYVRVHRQYADIERWLGTRETADIVYKDVTGAFTKVLVDYDYLDGTLWDGARPTYYLEVKTTTGPCKTPFFVSKSQYKRMRSYLGSRENVYVVLRVYNVDKERIGLRVYVDPAGKEASGELVFTGEVWTVTPTS